MTEVKEQKPMSMQEKLEFYLSVLNKEDLSKLPADKILEIRKELNPYGRTIKGSDKFLNFSITQLSQEYHKKLIITAFVGFLNRMCDEWNVPKNVPVVSVYDYLDDKTLLDTPEIVLKKGNESALYDYEFNRQMMQKRIIVKEFLEFVLQFNPDEHVRSAHRPNYKDKSRKPLDTMAARIAVNTLVKKDPEFRAAKKANDIENGTKMKKIKKTLISKDGTKKTIIKEIPINDTPATKPKPTNPKPLDETKPVDPNIDSVYHMIPPHDMFGRFKLYLTENYEELREAVNILYCDKPDFELAINPYAVHDTEEEAEAFKKQHRDEVIAPIYTVHTGKWNFFDSFKEQRDNVTFYNSKTIILEEMAKQQERDEKLGQDLMEKRVEIEKKKNLIETGPDSEAFKKWKKENAELEKMGAKHLGDTVDDDILPDTVEVPIWRVGKGGLEITRDKFLSKAEAPRVAGGAGGDEKKEK